MLKIGLGWKIRDISFKINNRKIFLHLLIYWKFQSILLFLVQKPENSSLIWATKETGISRTPTKKKILGEQVMFPVQVPDTKAMSGFKNAGCIPKVKMEVLPLLALCNWVCIHHRVSAKGKQQPIILSVKPCLIMMSQSLKIMSCSYLMKHFR